MQMYGSVLYVQKERSIFTTIPAHRKHDAGMEIMHCAVLDTEYSETRANPAQTHIPETGQIQL